jgi:hypothetical protein
MATEATAAVDERGVVGASELRERAMPALLPASHVAVTEKNRTTLKFA